MADDLLVVAALGIEARALRAGLPASASVIRCGMGRRRAGTCGATIAGRGGEQPLVIAGFAGALTDDLRAGQLVVATSVTDGTTTVDLPGGELLAAHLRRDGFDAVAGSIVSSESIVRGAPRRAALADRTGAIAVDTESAWLLERLVDHDARPRDVAVVRVVVDTPTRELWSPGLVGRGLGGARLLGRIGPSLAAWSDAVGQRRVVLAGPRSFCAGVERAIDIVRRAIDRVGAPVYVRRQIVHNTFVVSDLEGEGAVFVHELDEVPRGATVVIAAHGVAPEILDDASARGLHVIDATCPLVAKVHTEARRFARDGYHIVLVGHADHEEVIGTLGEARDRIVVVDHPSQIDALDVPRDARVAYLTQTTLAVDETADVISALADRFPDAVGPRAGDICYATQNRQEALRVVADECDLVLVVGSQNSSNSNRLVEVARRAGRRAELIDNAGEIDLRWLAGAHTIGVTAGASAPDHLVTDVVRVLDALGRIEIVEREVHVEDVRFSLPVEVR